MPIYYLGADVGGTKTHALIADSTGRACGFGEAGPGNHETVGYPGLTQALHAATQLALEGAGLSIGDIAGAGFGVAGYDWPSEREATLEAIRPLGLKCPLEAVNDALIGLLAGSPQGWGVAIVAGTGCNCRGWDQTRRREGMVTGAGGGMGEGAGAGEMVGRAVQIISHEWARRRPPSGLTPAFLAYTGAGSAAELLEGLIDGRLELTAAAAPLIFKIAAQGDPAALELVRWTGEELGGLAVGVIHQLEFEPLEFDVVLVGSLYSGSPLLIETVRRTIHAVAPRARLVRLAAPPVIGAVLLGMEAAGVRLSGQREGLIKTYKLTYA